MNCNDMSFPAFLSVLDGPGSLFDGGSQSIDTRMVFLPELAVRNYQLKMTLTVPKSLNDLAKSFCSCLSPLSSSKIAEEIRHLV